MADTIVDTGEASSQQQTAIDVSKLRGYVSKVVRTFFDEDTFVGVENSLRDCLEDHRNTDVLQKYIADAQLRALLVKGIPTKGMNCAAAMMSMNKLCSVGAWP